MKLFFLTSQLQALRIVDTLPWAFLFFGKIKKKISKFDLIIILFYSIFLVYGFFISTDTRSLLKVSSFLSLSILASRMKLNGYSNLNNKFYIFILIGLILEDFLINNFNFLSPLVRDSRGAFFFFKETSFFSLILFSIISFSRTIKLSHIFILFFIGIFSQSGLFWPLYLGLIIYKFSRKISQNFLSFFLISFLSYLIFFLYTTKDFSIIYEFVDYSDMMRIFINLTSLGSDCIGTIFLHSCSPQSTFLNLAREYFVKWENLTAQSAFFLIFTYFSYAGIVLTIFMLYLMNKKIERHNNRGLILFNIIVQMFIQGFLLSPLFFWVLSLNEENNLRK